MRNKESRKQIMKIKANLEAIHSLPDINGNSYWAFRYTDNETGKIVNGTISGGESNLSAVPFYMNVKHEHDPSVNFSVIPMKIRAFNKLTKDWKYFACRSEDIANKIKEELGK